MLEVLLPLSSLAHVTIKLVRCRVKVTFLAWENQGRRCYTPRMLPAQMDEAERQLRLLDREAARVGLRATLRTMFIREGWS
jgi:hypothetical protein